MPKNFPNETIAELLIYLAENESFSSVKKLGTFDISSVKATLKNLAKKLQDEEKATPIDFKKIKGIDQRTREILETLSPQESKQLLRAFSLDV